MKLKQLFYYSLILYLVFFPLVPSRLNWKYPITVVMLLVVLIIYIFYCLKDKERFKIFQKNLIIFFKEPISILMTVITLLMFISIVYCTDVILVLKETLRFGIATGLYFIIRFEFDVKFYKDKLIKLIYYPAIAVMLIGFYQFYIGMGTTKAGQINRVESTTGNVNIYGAYLIVLFFPLLMITIKEVNKKRKIFFSVELLMIFLSIIISYSRNALLALVLGCLIISVYYRKKLLYVLVPGFLSLWFIPSIQERILTGKDGGRFDIYFIAIKVIQDHPIIGVAIGNFEAVYKDYFMKYPQYRHNPNIYHTHNIYLKFLSELGIIGFIPFIIFMIIVLRNSIKSVKVSQGYIKNLCIGIVVINILSFIISMFDNVMFLPKVMNYYFILMAISSAIIANDNSLNTKQKEK